MEKLKEKKLKLENYITLLKAMQVLKNQASEVASGHYSSMIDTGITEEIKRANKTLDVIRFQIKKNKEVKNENNNNGDSH